MTDDELINSTILFLNSKRNGYRFGQLEIPDDKKKRIKDLMLVDGLIELLDNDKQLYSISDMVKLTPKSIEIIVKHENYLSFLNAQIKKNRTTAIKTVTPIAISILSFIMTIISVVFVWLNYTKGKEIERKDLIIKTQSETIDKMKRK